MLMGADLPADLQILSNFKLFIKAIGRGARRGRPADSGVLR